MTHAEYRAQDARELQAASTVTVCRPDGVRVTRRSDTGIEICARNVRAFVHRISCGRPAFVAWQG